MRVLLFLIAALFIFGSHAFAQKSIEPPDENASAEEAQKWLSGALVKYGSYKTRVEIVDISNVRFEGCTIKYTVTRKSGSTSTAVMGATRTVNSTKDDVSIDTGLMTEAGTTLSDHIYSELQTIEIVAKTESPSGLGDDRPIELVVKREAGKAIRAALLRLAHGCSTK
jgi:hypothetical protein